MGQYLPLPSPQPGMGQYLEWADEEPMPRGILPDGVEPPQARGSGGFRLMERLLGERGEAQAAGSLSRDDIRRLQATLFELLECKRILDQAR